MRRFVGLVAALSAVVMACGGGDSNGGEAKSTAQDERARSLLLTLEDLPPNSTEIPRDDAQGVEAGCPWEFRESLRGAARGPLFFNTYYGYRISQEVFVLDTAADAATFVERMEAVADCYVSTIEKGFTGRGEIDYSDPFLARMTFSTQGDAVAAYRIQFHAAADGPTNFFADLPGFIDLVGVAEGNVVTVLSTLAYNPPPTLQLLAGLEETSLAKAR